MKICTQIAIYSGQNTEKRHKQLNMANTVHAQLTGIAIRPSGTGPSSII